MQYIQYVVFATVPPLIVGLVLWIIKRERLSLQYDLIESEPFPREGGEGKYFIIKLRNTGNKAIENGYLEINFDGGEIETLRVSDERLISNIKQSKSIITAGLPLLNSKETLSITMTTKGSPLMVRLSPKIIARAVGVTAIPTKQRDTTADRVYMVIAALIASITTAMTIYYNIGSKFDKTTSNIDEILKLNTEETIEKGKEIIKKLDEVNSLLEEKEQGKPERQDLIFSVLNKAGLSHIFPQIISSNDDITYKNTGFFLMHLFLTDEANGKKYINAIEGLLEIKAIAPSSRGVLLYLLGKIEQRRGNNAKAMEYFGKVKNEAPLMYDHLMAQDPAYDLDSLRKWLLKNWVRK